MTSNDKILNFFDNLDEIFNNFVDRVEMSPVPLTPNVYLSGFKRSFNNAASIQAHLKQINNIKLIDTKTSPTTEGGWNLMDNDGEIYLNTYAISQTLLDEAVTKFIGNYKDIKTVHIGTTKWKDNTDTYTQTEVTLYENKKVACKEALNFRKLHQNVSTTFESLDAQGQTLPKEPSDFELITCKTS